MPRQPNLLFLFTDEQRADTMACYGNDWISTPNLNRLAGESCVFENAYVSQPVCTPSRSTIMTGLYGHSNGCTANNLPLRPEVKTLAEMIDPRYVRGYFGKWHLGDEIAPQHGFDHWISVEDLYRNYYSKAQDLSRLSDYHHFLLSSGQVPDRESRGARVFSRGLAAKLPEGLTKASFLADQTCRFLQENQDKPFALYVNFLEPHMPFYGPFDALYPAQGLPVGPEFRKRPPQDASLLHQKMAEHYLGMPSWQGVDLTSEPGWRQLRAQYLGLVTLVDNAVGRILAALEQTGQADNTIVVFTSDHGDMLGEHGMFAKCVMYEEALRVPLLVRAPWLGRQGRQIPGRLSQVDLVPTLLEMMGQTVPAGLQGASRAGVLAGAESLAGNDAFIEWNSSNGRTGLLKGLTPAQQQCLLAPWRTVVSADGWKLNLSALDRCELYNLSADPFETRNLIDGPAQKGRIADLTARIRDWQIRTGDTAKIA